jgi:hypothetical protein
MTILNLGGFRLTTRGSTLPLVRPEGFVLLGLSRFPLFAFAAAGKRPFRPQPVVPL